MRLLEALACGIRGAENGTANIYQRGTTTGAVLYSDLEGDVALTSGPVPLDSYGAAVVYTNELVDIEVNDEDGALVRSVSAGDSAPGVECRSTSFTGTDYTDGSQAAGYPVDLKTILDRWITSAGAVDWKVLLDGSATNLSDAIGSYGTPFHNVKSPAYGAEGDGVTDDTAAINAAIAAAKAADGGTVVFPGGEYRINGTLTLLDKVSLLGIGGPGPGQVVLKMDNNLVLQSRSENEICTIANLTIALVGSAPDSEVLDVGATGNYVIENCVLGWYATGTISVGGSVVKIGNAPNITFKGCVFYIPNANAYGVYQPVLGGGLFAFLGCRFENLDAAWGDYHNISAYNVSVVGCQFDNSNVTSFTAGTPANIGSRNTVMAVGNQVGNPGGGVGTYDYAFIDASANNYVFEAANGVYQNTKLCRHSISAAGTETHHCSTTRDASCKLVTQDTSYTVPAETFGLVQVTRTDPVPACVYTLPECFTGTKLTFIVHNTHNSTVLTGFTFTGATVRNPHAFTFTPAANSMQVMTMVMCKDDETNNTFWLIRDHVEFVIV